MTPIRAVLRRTAPYRFLLHKRRVAELRKWTAHDDEMRRFYDFFVKSGDLCFDVGANLGNRTKVFRSLGARVVAVEPQAECLSVLHDVYAEDPQVTLVGIALGPREGSAEMQVSDAHTISSMSKEWIDAVRKSGRFASYAWNEVRRVEMTTLDRLIEIHGVPAFVKVDVEGFEFEVVKGLSQPVGAISLEFTPEFLDATFSCLGHLASLGEIRVNYSIGESMRFASNEWLSAPAGREELASLRGDRAIFGDLYVRFV